MLGFFILIEISKATQDIFFSEGIVFFVKNGRISIVTLREKKIAKIDLNFTKKCRCKIVKEDSKRYPQYDMLKSVD